VQKRIDLLWFRVHDTKLQIKLYFLSPNIQFREKRSLHYFELQELRFVKSFQTALIVTCNITAVPGYLVLKTRCKFC
jgi:hypothetical protein